MEKNIKVSFLGGVGEIGKNMTAIEYGGHIVVIDAGMTFPSDDMPGVDYIIPDMSYLTQNRDKICAVLLTHGHEDHIGAITYFCKSLPNVPIYATKLTLALVEYKFSEKNLPMPKSVCIKAGDAQQISCFKVEFIKVSHSITGAVALAIHTPQGIIVHTGDYKIDYTPIDNEMINLPKFAELGKRGVLLMLGESTNVERDGYTMSERTVGASFDKLFDVHKNKRIIIATFASNVHRLQQIINTAEKYGRKVALGGRSMEKVSNIAMELGELTCDPNTLVDINKIGKIPYDKLVIIVTGSQGEPLSALSRIADGKYKKVEIDKNDTVILSSTPIPGNERMVYSVINKLARSGADVLYESLRDLHVSGHACKEELKLMLSLIKPKFFIPVHGEYRHLKKHGDLAISLGVNPANIALADVGDCYTIQRGRLTKLEKVPSGNMFVDGLTIDDMSSVVLKDRRILSEDGVLLVLVGINSKTRTIASGPDIVYRGIQPLSDSDIVKIKQIIINIIRDSDSSDYNDNADLNDAIIKAMRNYVRKNMQKNPMIIPVIMAH